jgi:AraC family transcriptional regulator of adaptative response / DNA-3-methyladenine glycosylase II
LVENYGEEVQNPLTGKKALLFPQPEVLATEPLTELQTTQARKATIREFCRQFLAGKIRLDSEQDPIAFKEALLQIKGIGTWTAEYISLRALGDTDAFPSGDLILKRALIQNPEVRIEALKPWRGYAAIYLWKEYKQNLSRKKGENHEIVLQDHKKPGRKAHPNCQS